jgi:PAS domain S-box-containing protein
MTAAIRVLYVDDEPNLLDIGKQFLENSGEFTVTTAVSAPEGIRLLGQERFDAIISDYQMPGMDGIQLLIEVRKRFGPIPLILFTGRGREEVVIQAINSGADFYIQKGGEPKAQFAELTHKIKSAVFRKRAEDALRESEENYRDLYENAPNAYYTVDTDGRIVRCNQRAGELLRIPPDELIGKKISGFYAHTDSGKVKARGLFTTLRAGKEIVDEELQMQRADGTVIWINLTVNAMRDSSGAIIGSRTIITDITQRRAMGDELQIKNEHIAESKRVLDTLIHNLTGMMYRCRNDPEWTMEFVSDGCEALTGYRAEDLVGNRVISYGSLVFAEDRQRVWDSVQEGIDSKKPFQMVYRILNQQGKVRWVWEKGRGVFGETGVLIALEGYITDITERKVAEEVLCESEGRFRVLFEQSPIPYQSLDENGRLLVVNDAWLETLGYQHDEVIGRKFSDFIAPEFIEPVRENFSRFKLAGGTHIEFDMKRKDGSLITVSLEGKIGHYPTGSFRQTHCVFRNITELKRAEEANRQNLAFLQSVTEGTSDAVFIKDTQGRYLMLNTSTARFVGKLREDILGKDDTALFSPDEARKVMEGDHSVMESGVTQTYEEFVTIGSKVHTFLSAKGPVRDMQGQVIGLFGIARDITERKKAEEEIVHLAQEWQHTFDATNDAIWILDKDGRVMRSNKTAEKIFKLPYREIIGKYCWEIVHGTTQPIPECPNLRAKISRHRETMELQIDGNSFEVTVDPILDAEGGYDGAVHIVSDITRRKRAEAELSESEELFRRVFEEGPLGMAMADLTDGRLFRVNRVLCEMLGYTEEELMRLTFLNVTHPDYRATDVEAVRGLREGHIQKHTTEKRYMKKNGDVFWGARALTRIHSADGKSIYALAMIDDITERKQAENALRQANKKLNLMSGITRHDIKNQILSLNGYLGLSKKYAGDTAKISEFITKEEIVVKTMERQIAFTKEYEAIGVNSPVWQDCRALVETAVVHVPLGSIALKNDINAGADVFADPLIVKVFYNLLDNAVRHGGKITVIRFSAEERNDEHFIVCEDDGEGIPAEEKELIFGWGFGKNTGMGLFLAREILSITGITITETGEPGKGARFEMTVPKGGYHLALPGAGDTRADSGDTR